MHPLFWLSIAALFTASLALQRTIGDPNDPSLRNLTTECLQTTPGAGFTYGKCPYLVRCVLDGLHSEISAGMQSGSNIVSLVPTTLALIGVSPTEIVQLAFASPLQGLVMCVFGIGLPNNLFRQFSSTDHSTRNQDTPNSAELRVRQWTVPVPARQWQWQGMIKAKAVAIDIIFLVLLGVMVWQTVTLNYSSVISWRCDYSFLLICWPVACVVWLMIAMAGLSILAQKVRIRYREHDQEEWSEVSWLVLVQHRYNLLGRFNGENDTASSTMYLVMEDRQNVTTRRKSPQSRYGAYYSVEITMRYDWAWQYYEAATEALAVGIYLYATFVLTSSLFVSGSTGIVYMTVMSGALTPESSGIHSALIASPALSLDLTPGPLTSDHPHCDNCLPLPLSSAQSVSIFTMAGVFQNVFGGAASSGAVKSDDDFADFAAASPAGLTGQSASAAAVTGAGAVPYTAWYRVWERVTPQDFLQEAFVLPFLLILLGFHFWGTRKNKGKAKTWAVAHAPIIESEFAVVGFGGVAKGTSAELIDPEKLLKEKSKQEYQSYATGRQNVAFLDVSIKLVKRYNPLVFIMDNALGLFFESFPPPVERVESTLYTFDGKEKEIVPTPGGDVSSVKVANSTYDGFIWAVVHKNAMRQLRQDRYDASMTFTKDNSKLPAWVTVMTESAEITDFLLTPQLIKAIEEAGDAFEYLIITDQPIDKPLKIEEAVPKKRIQLSLSIPSNGYTPTLSLYSYFLRLPDTLVSGAHFRPEVTRKLRNAREEEIRKLRRADEEEKAEERKYAAEKLKKEERERLLRGMTADEQKKFLEREKEKEQRKMMKKSTRRG